MESTCSGSPQPPDRDGDDWDDVIALDSEPGDGHRRRRGVLRFGDLRPRPIQRFVVLAVAGPESRHHGRALPLAPLPPPMKLLTRTPHAVMPMPELAEE